MINSYINFFQNPICNHKADINRITKTFLVTEENRNFTVWYCSVLENPGDHNDQQPFFSIFCDLADNSQFCFDGISIPGNTAIYYDDCQGQDPYQVVKYTDWACHRVHIPAEQIGNYATLEITAADCARGGHWGYAYIDGICEPCAGSSYGSGTIQKPDIVVSCDGDSITIKGSYTTPTIDGNFNILDQINVPGFSIYDLSIDTATKTFRFRIVKTDFQSPNDDCRDVIAYLKFKNASGDFLPDVPTNGIEICYNNFLTPTLSLTIGSCHRNNPNDNNYSDDYYYVNFIIQSADNTPWTLERVLDDPPSGESGRYFLNTSGFGNGIYNLGPVMIQDGAWTLILNHNHCSDTFYITPPEYCSGCIQLSQTKISNITCLPGNNWAYNLTVEGTPPAGSTYRINNETMDRYFGITYTNNNLGSISQNCIDLIINYHYNGPIVCNALLKVCPPKPCDNNENCEFEAYLDQLNCLSNGSSYTINFITNGGGYPCYKAIGNMTNVSGAFSNPLGPFVEDMTIILYSCSVPFDCSCQNPDCYKVYFVDKPDDCPRDPEERGYSSNGNHSTEVWVLPNPVHSNELLIKSKLNSTHYEIYSTTGSLVKSEKFDGSEHKADFNYTQGIYYLRYKDSSGIYRIMKIIKL